MTPLKKTAIIIGAGPAGLTAAYELLQTTDIKPIVYEMSGDIGGISKTVNFKGNRIDIGGHRFFSKSDRVMNWWQDLMPVDNKEALPKGETSDRLLVPQKNNGRDLMMIIRRRLSRIFFLRSFFEYPVTLNLNTIKNLGLVRMFKIGMSYMKIRLFPIKHERHLEDFFINRFGHELYLTFFKDYTEKVWGVPCNKIKPEWGAQRIKGLSITKALLHALKNMLGRDKSISQKNVETSLIEQFMYPKYGPGQMWEEVARRIIEQGGEIHLHQKIEKLRNNGNAVAAVSLKNTKDNSTKEQMSDYVISTMPIRDLIRGFDNVPDEVSNVSEGLMYRDFVTVGLLLNKFKVKNKTEIKTINELIPDNWIYIQERDVKIGRLQIFNNWSPYMVNDPEKVWIGLEYFCNEGDELWSLSDENFAKLGIKEMTRIGLIDEADALDSVVIRMPKAYPAYFGTYDNLPVVRKYLDNYENLYLVGRNGLHRYNNQDHSMLTAMAAVKNISTNIKTKDNIWEVNAEQDYHEEK